MNNENVKILGYRYYTVSTSESINDGSAIVINHEIQHKLVDDFIIDVLAV